ncbi:MAG: APC family permease [Solirubrobacterales bacterium]
MSDFAPAPASGPVVPDRITQEEDKGLERSLGFFSTLTIGMNSTAPAYSLAAVLAGIVVAVGLQAPASLIVSFIPMFLIAASFYYMNRADPDCGTTFTWVSRALGPWPGWIAGWAVCMTGVLVIGSLADVAALYTFGLFGLEGLADSVVAVTALAVLFIIFTTTLCVIGTEISASFQTVLSALQVGGLLLFAGVALYKAISGDIPVDPVAIGSMDVALSNPTIELSWFLPWEIPSTTALTAGLLIGVFIYWGWESSLSLNEESEDSNASGRAGITATVLLVLTYLFIATALIAYAGPAVFASANAQGIESRVFDDLAKPILGSPLDKLVLIAVLTSALASTQTTILPGARTSLSMAFHGALPKAFGDVSPRFFTPVFSTIAIAVLAIGWYVPLNLFSQGSLYDSLQALSLLIAFYYAINGLACFTFYRKEILRPGIWIPLCMGLLAVGAAALVVGGVTDYYDVAGPLPGLTWLGIGAIALLVITLFAGAKAFKPALFIGFAPLTGALLLGFVLVRSVLDLANPGASESGATWLGVTPALVMGVGFMLLGVILMVVWRFLYPKPFFARHLETVAPDSAAKAPAAG